MRYFRLMLFICGILGGFSTSFSQSHDKVFYSSFRPQGWDIYLSKDNGKSFTPFTIHASLDYDAKISPDGKWVVFTSERNGLPHLFIKHIEGDSIPRLLVSSNSMQDQVDFSPDGQFIVFLSTHEGNADIYKMLFLPADTTDISVAQNLTNNPAGDFRPSFSNDGATIAFSSDRDHKIKPHQFFSFAMHRTGDIYTMSAQGGNATRLTEVEHWDGSPTWSNDDAEIIFYSDRNGQPMLFKMSRTGADQEVISPAYLSCYSPTVMADDKILFTSMDERTKAFSILGLNTNTQQLDSTLVQDFDMFNVDYHKNGVVVFHGGKKPEEMGTNRTGFEGDLLVKNSPEKVMLGENELELFGVRRAFAAPPSIDGNEVIFDVFDARGPEDLLTPFVFPLALLPLFAVIWFIIGITKSISKRKVIPFWKHILFAFISIAMAALIALQLFNLFVASASPLNEVRWFTLLMLGVSLLLLFLSWRFYRNRKSQEKAVAPVYKLYMFMFAGNAFVLAYVAIFCTSFSDVRPDFYAVDYTTNKVTHLFQFEADPNLNPLLVRIIDTKFTPDGQYLQFSVGGFRADPKTQGCIYRYNLKDKTLERITDLDSNNGFADFSKDNASMVFRSGRTGTMDIYIKENDSLTNLTNSPAKENFPVISHDGNMIAYCSDANGTDISGVVKTMDIYVLARQADNTWSQPRQLTSYSGQEGHPHFSPDGKWLIFTSEEFGINDEQPLVQPYIFSPQMYGEITAIRLSDGEKVRLTHNKWEDGAPLWITGN